MITVRCIEEVKDEYGNLEEYIVEDISNNKRIHVRPGKLVEVIKYNIADVINMRLTSDGKLERTNIHDKQNEYVLITREIIMRINCSKNLSFKIKDDLDSLENTALLIGSNIININKHLIAVKTDLDIILVSDLPFRLGNTSSDIPESGKGVFEDTRFKSIDLRSVDCSQTTNMSNLFKGSIAKTINLSGIDTSQVQRMDGMFHRSYVKVIDLTGIDTSNVYTMRRMFSTCEAHTIILNGIDTSKVKDMSKMFFGCKATELYLNSFNTVNVNSMKAMFKLSFSHKIDISSFTSEALVQNKDSLPDFCSSCNAEFIVKDSYLISEIQREKRRIL